MAVMTGGPSGSAIALDDLDVTRLHIGYTLCALGSDDAYILVESDAVIDDDNTVSVRDNDTLRWRKFVIAYVEEA